MPKWKTISACLLFQLSYFFFPIGLKGQEIPAKPDTFFLAKKKGLVGSLAKSISVSGELPISADSGVLRNEASFSIFTGKSIHAIYIQKPGFNGTVNDTTRITKNIFNDLGNRLHPNTADKIIRRNLFFKEGDTLYPSLVAYNERYLRDISYLQDAKILVRENDENPNEVDVIILCKDVFPIGGSADLGSEKVLNFEVNDDNLAGSGDRISFQSLIDLDRNQKYGFAALFTKRNFRGSFINFSLGYSNITPTFNSGRKEETTFYIRADLPMVSPYSKWTGSYETAYKYTTNRYVSDSLYESDFKYRFRIVDSWVGYNIGAKKQLTSQQIAKKLKHLLAIRGVYRIYQDIPKYYVANYNSDYSDLSTVLVSFNVFEQDYYHTNFIYGFGRNEDVPEGFSMSFTGGWTYRNQISRPYLGFDYQRNYFNNKKSFLNFILRFGGYYDKGNIEDVSFLTGVETFTKLRKLGSSKWLLRHFISGSFTQLINTRLNDPLRLSSIYGIPEFNAIPFHASTRITTNAESVFYNTWKFVGFNFAPFVFGNISFLKEKRRDLFTGDIYAAFGGGVRTRNENLVFGTMEFRASYYPKVTQNMNNWNVTFNTALQFKYNSQLVKRPDFVIVN